VIKFGGKKGKAEALGRLFAKKLLTGDFTLWGRWYELWGNFR